MNSVSCSTSDLSGVKKANFPGGAPKPAVHLVARYSMEVRSPLLHAARSPPLLHAARSPLLHAARSPPLLHAARSPPLLGGHLFLSEDSHLHVRLSHHNNTRSYLEVTK